jgi:hypothetical protein
MVELVADIGLKIAAVMMGHNPRYPIHIPFDITTSTFKEPDEWVLSFTDESQLEALGAGLYIKNYTTGEAKFFPDMVECLLYLHNEVVVDWKQLDERITVAAMALAALAETITVNFDKVYGEGFSKQSVEDRLAIEEELFSRPDATEQSVREEYLTKKLNTKKEETGPKLTVVEEEDD